MQTVLYFQSPSRTSAAEKLAGVRETAATLGWHVQVIGEPPTAQSVRALVRFWQPLGAIVEGGGATQPADPKIFGRLPTVFFDRDPSTLPRSARCVCHDSPATAALAARELMTLDYTRFAFVHPARRHFWAEAREEGFRRALALNGRPLEVFPPVGSDNPLVLQRRLRTFLANLPRPCAVFAANDSTAQEVLVAAAALGIHVPDALAVIGVDNDIGICEHTPTTLTSVEPDFRGGGRMAALMLHELCTASKTRTGAGRQTFGPLRIVRRASTRRLTVHDAKVEAALLLIRNEACHGLTAARALASFDCSRGQAEIRFRAATGRSVLEEIHAVRLARAKELLANPNLQVKALATSCGYQTPTALMKFFRQATGMTPTAWRKQRLR